VSGLSAAYNRTSNNIIIIIINLYKNQKSIELMADYNNSIRLDRSPFQNKQEQTKNNRNFNYYIIIHIQYIIYINWLFNSNKFHK